MTLEGHQNNIQPKVDMAPLLDLARKQPGEIRRLDPQKETDRQVALLLDTASANEGGALNPFDPSSKGTMSHEQWTILMTDHSGHAFRVFEAGSKPYGLGYEYNDTIDKNDSRYDAGQVRRFAYLKEQGLVSPDTKLTEFNWWFDLADTQLPQGKAAMKDALKEGWVTASLVEVFARHRERYRQSGQPYKELVILKVCEPDEIEDMQLAKRLGFTVAAEKRGYDFPNKIGEDTFLVLTESNFAKALEKPTHPSK